MNQKKSFTSFVSSTFVFGIFSGVLLTLLGVFLFGKRGAVKNPLLTPDANQVYAIVNGTKIYEKEVWPQIKEELRQLEKNKYLLKKQAVENILRENSAAETKHENIEFTQQEFGKFLSERKIDFRRLGKKAQEDLVANFKIHKSQLQQKEKMQARTDIDWMIPMTFLDSPTSVGKGFLPPLASASTSRSLTIFANYHCPFCKEAQNKIQTLQQEYKDTITIRFRFSMQEPETSLVFLSALATGCAKDQGKFSEFHQALFAKPPLDVPGLKLVAESSGLDKSEFTKCLESMKYKENVLADLNEAEKLGLGLEPTAFVNGHQLPIQEPLETYEAILNQKY